MALRTDTGGMTSAYNEGMLQIERLNYMWVQANNQSRAGNYKGWRWTLDTIWRELSRDAIKKATGKLEAGKFSEVTQSNVWFKEYALIDQKIALAVEKKDGRSLYEHLSTLEIFLRALQDAVGKGGKYKDQDEDEMD